MPIPEEWRMTDDDIDDLDMRLEEYVDIAVNKVARCALEEAITIVGDVNGPLRAAQNRLRAKLLEIGLAGETGGAE